MFESDVAKSVYQSKYSLKGEENWAQTSWRIASNVAEVERNYGATEEEVLEKAKDFTEAILNRAFLPGGRIISNIGTGIKNLYNCFFFRIEDSRDSIYDVLKNAAEIFAWGGGVGIDISNLREKGAIINTTGGKSSGAVSFLKLFDLTGDIIQQASRRAAIIAILDVSHPDILEFIHCKSEMNRYSEAVIEEFQNNLEHNGFEKEVVMDTLSRTLADRQLMHFNISVILSNEFMKAVEEDLPWDLISPATGEVVETISAKELMNEIAEHIWMNGDPGVLFRERIDRDNVVEYLDNKLGVNPCVAGDTKILTVYDGVKTFKELADAGKDILVHSWNPVSKEPTIKIMRNPRKTRENVEILEVEFDSGLKVKCTPDHGFYSFRGEKVEAKDLQIGKSVRAFSMSKHRDGHLRVHNWDSKKDKADHKWVHRLVWENFYNKVDEGLVINHKDRNPENNDIENLELLTPEEHNSVHYQERLEKGFYNHHRESEKSWKKRLNHKVVSVTSSGYEDVYNGTVDDSHTYVIVDDTPIAGIQSGVISANCGEINLISGEPCNLASINLHSVVDNGEINYPKLEYLVRLGVNFLDNVHDISENKIDEVNEKATDLRRIGLGVMGFADMLAELEIPYDSKEAIHLAKYLSWFITKFAWMESISLGQERGKFPAYDSEKANLNGIRRILEAEYMPDDFKTDEFMSKLQKMGLRNVSVTAIAPTGSIALIAEVNSSIEPFYSLAYQRFVTEGESNKAKKKFTMTNAILGSKLLERGINKSEMKSIEEYILEHKSVQGCNLIPMDLQAVFKTAHDLAPEDHINIQAAWQTHTSNAISKTINIPNEFEKEDIPELLVKMWKKDIKSSTIYRDGSRFFQILN